MDVRQLHYMHSINQIVVSFETYVNIMNNRAEKIQSANSKNMAETLLNLQEKN